MLKLIHVNSSKYSYSFCQASRPIEGSQMDLNGRSSAPSSCSLRCGSANFTDRGALSFFPTDLCSDNLLESLGCCFMKFYAIFGGSVHDLTSMFSVFESW